MEDLNSDSSKEETSSDNESVVEMETESEDSNDLEETIHSQKSSNTSKRFELPFLLKDKISQGDTLNSYLHNKNNFPAERKTLLLSKTTEPVPANFNPWWESLSTAKKITAGSSTMVSKNADAVSYSSWFDKSISSEVTSNWLSGPQSKSSNTGNVPEVVDIEVPSIYGNVSRPKGRRELKRERKAQRNKTTGKKWFDMKLPDVDSKTKMDMELLQMRRALNPKQFYKQNDRKGLPKYFQLGTVVDEGTDFFSSRLTKKQRKQTLVEELMADANVRQYNKKKYEELQQKQRSKKVTKKRKA